MDGGIFDFKIDLDAFEEVIANEKALAHFNARHGRRFRDLYESFEARLNGLKRFEPLPEIGDLRALQIGFFDNGPVPPRSNRSKEPLRQRTQYSFNLKAWTRTGKIDFSKPGQVAWVANVYLWNEADTRFHLDKLHREKCIGDSTVALMDAAIAQAGAEAFNPNGRPILFGLPLRSQHKLGKKWMDDIAVAVTLDNGKPEHLAIIRAGDGLMVDHFADTDARGISWADIAKECAGKGERSTTTCQARIGFTADLGPWSTQII